MADLAAKIVVHLSGKGDDRLVVDGQPFPWSTLNGSVRVDRDSGRPFVLVMIPALQVDVVAEPDVAET